jgi:hypothetical protein
MQFKFFFKATAETKRKINTSQGRELYWRNGYGWASDPGEKTLYETSELEDILSQNWGRPIEEILIIVPCRTDGIIEETSLKEEKKYPRAVAMVMNPFSKYPGSCRSDLYVLDDQGQIWSMDVTTGSSSWNKLPPLKTE